MSEDENGEMSPELEKFLKDKCKSGEFMTVMLMVNIEQVEPFIRHLEAFSSQCAAIDTSTGNAALLGKAPTELSLVEEIPPVIEDE